MPLQLRDKSDFILELTPAISIFKSNLFNTRSLSSQSVGVFAQIQTLDPPFSELKSSMAGQNQAAQVNSSTRSFIRHLDFQFLPKISSPLFLRSSPLNF
jgi:hypothetical protein